MNQRLALPVCLIFLTQAILVSPVKSYGQFPPAAVVGRYILQADKYWIAYNKTVEQLRTEGYDVPGDPSWLIQVNYTRLNYTFKCRIVELSWPNVTNQNFEGGYDLNVTAHRIMDDGSIGEKLASFLRPNQPAHLGFLWKCHDPGFGVGFNPSAFIIGNQFSTAWPPLNIEYSVDGTEILSDTPWGQNETYVLHGRFENSSHCYKNTGWCDAESGLYMKLIWDSKTPRYVAHEEMKTIETGIDARAQARFNGTAVGECFVGVGWVIGPWPPVAAFLGEGAVRVRGSCAVDEYPPNINIPFTYYYAVEGAKAFGTLSAKWDSHMIRVSIHSEDSTCGFFVDQGDVNYFTVGVLPGDPLWTTSLTYVGVYKDKSGTYAVSGKCGVFAVPIGDPDKQVMAMGAALFKQDATPLLSVVWVPYDVPIGPPPGIIIHAADQFVHSVEIITKP